MPTPTLVNYDQYHPICCDRRVMIGLLVSFPRPLGIGIKHTTTVALTVIAVTKYPQCYSTNNFQDLSCVFNLSGATG